MTKKDPTSEKIRIAGICGSLRHGSYTRMAVDVALAGGREVGAETQLIDLKTYQLTFCDGKSNEAQYPKDVFKLRQEVQRAQEIILGTPEYHGGYSGVLKNALDLMGFEEFEGKMIGLVGVSGGRMGAFNALHSLRDICRALHAWVIPEQASIPQAANEFNDEGRFLHDDLEKRVKEVGRQVARFAYLHSSNKTREFLQLWEAAPDNPGGGGQQE